MWEQGHAGFPITWLTVSRKKTKNVFVIKTLLTAQAGSKGADGKMNDGPLAPNVPLWNLAPYT